MYLYVYSTSQWCPNLITKTFRIEDFFHLPYVNDTGGAPWAANTSANFRKKSKRPYWYTQGLGGNWFLEKTRSRKSYDTVPLIWSVMYIHTVLQYVAVLKRVVCVNIYSNVPNSIGTVNSNLEARTKKENKKYIILQAKNGWRKLWKRELRALLVSMTCTELSAK